MIALLLAAQIGSSTLALREREFVEKISPVYTADAFAAYSSMCEVTSPIVQRRLDNDLKAAITGWRAYFGLSLSEASVLLSHMQYEASNTIATQYSCRQLTEGRVLRRLDRLSHSFAPHTPLAAPP